MTEQESRVFQFALKEYEEKGMNFTMKDLSSRIGISKKTLYEIIDSKEKVITLIIDEARNNIKSKQKIILQDQTMDIVDKVRGILSVIPEFHNVFNYVRLSEIEKVYPKLYKKIIDMLNDDWEPTFKLFNEGIKQNKIKPCNLILFKEMYVAALTAVYNKKLVQQQGQSYKEILQDIISILFHGIIII